MAKGGRGRGGSEERLCETISGGKEKEKEEGDGRRRKEGEGRRQKTRKKGNREVERQRDEERTIEGK